MRKFMYTLPAIKANLLVLTLASTLFAGCAEKKTVESTPPAPTAPVVGADADAHGCKASAGYQWSSLQNSCIRSFELPLQLLHNDKTTGAGVVFSADKKQAEVFSAPVTVVLSAQSDVLFTGNAGGTDWYLEQKNGKWRFGKMGEAMPSYMEE